MDTITSIIGIPINDFLKLVGKPDIFEDGYGGKYDSTKGSAVCLYKSYRECKEGKPIQANHAYSYVFIFDKNKLTGIDRAIID